MPRDQNAGGDAPLGCRAGGCEPKRPQRCPAVAAPEMPQRMPTSAGAAVLIKAILRRARREKTARADTVNLLRTPFYTSCETPERRRCSWHHHNRGAAARYILTTAEEDDEQVEAEKEEEDEEEAAGDGVSEPDR